MPGLTSADVHHRMGVGLFQFPGRRLPACEGRRNWQASSLPHVILVTNTPMKLAAKLIFVFLVGVVAIVAMFSWQTIRHQESWEQERREAHASELVHAVAPAIEKAWKEGGRITIQQAVEVTSRSVAGHQIRWMNPEETPQTQAPTTKTTTRRTSSISFTDADGKRTACSYVPFEVDGDKIGTVEVVEPTDKHDARVRRSVYASLLSLLGVAAFSGFVIYFGGVQLVGKPLNRLIRQVGEIGDGQLEQKPAIESNDELGKLAIAISDMSHRIGQQQATIRHTDRLGTIGTLAAGVAHELGTPLNVVAGRAGLIAGGKLTEQEVVASAETIQSEAQRMTAIIRQLLDFARQTPAPKSPLDLREVVERTCELMSSIAKKSSVTIEPQISDSPIFVNGDSAQLQQVTTNLLSNAIAAMPDGGTVKVLISQSDNVASISVTDTGSGIDPEQLDRIFEPFVTTKDVGQGTGLGLSIAYGIVKEHDGQIKVESEPRVGTTFHVLLPISDNNEATS